VTYLVESWKTTTGTEYLGVLILTFALGFVVESLASLNQTLVFRARDEMKKNVVHLNNKEHAYYLSAVLRVKQLSI
jgi:hypothetical protein